MANRTMLNSRLLFRTGFKLVCSCTGFKLVGSCTGFKLVGFCTGFKLVCSTYYSYHHHHSRFPSHDHYHQLSYGYVSPLLTPPKGRSSK
jgi:hypothetical protein